VADNRNCEQCGAAFAPRREHARFCSARCRVAWNRQNVGGSAAEAGALDWSIVAMQEITGRLLRARDWDRLEAFGVISEAVWWATMVDATLMRYHPGDYNRVLAAMADSQREAIEDRFAGLRFVRNWMGYHADHADFIQPQESGGAGPVAAWTWKPLPEPELASLPPRGQDWERARYRAYQAQLAGHPIGETFSQAATFLQLAAESSLSPSDEQAQPLFPRFKIPGSAHQANDAAARPDRRVGFA
jgi:hypothetical protein